MVGCSTYVYIYILYVYIYGYYIYMVIIYIWSFSVAIENHHAMNRSASFCNIYEWFIFHMKFRHVYRSHLETVRHIDAESSVSRMLVCWMMYLRFPSPGVQLFEKNLSGAWYIYICVCMVIIYIWLLYIYIIGHLDDEERGKMIIHGKSMKSQKKTNGGGGTVDGFAGRK